MSGVPVSKIVHVSSRVHRRAFGGHADVPQGARRRGGRRWGGEVVSLRSTGPVLHDLLVFGSLVLEPYFHLEEKERGRVNNRLKIDPHNNMPLHHVQRMQLVRPFHTR